MQNADGGFGSGHGQRSHAAPSYAAILSLAMVGGDEALSLVNRRSLYELGSACSPVIFNDVLDGDGLGISNNWTADLPSVLEEKRTLGD